MALINYYAQRPIEDKEDQCLNIGHNAFASKKEMIYDLSKEGIGNGNGYFRIDESDNDSVVHISRIYAKFNHVAFYWNIFFSILVSLLLFLFAAPVTSFLITMGVFLFQGINYNFYKTRVETFNKSRF